LLIKFSVCSENLRRTRERRCSLAGHSSRSWSTTDTRSVFS